MAFYVKLFGSQEDCMEYLRSDDCLFPNVSYCQNENVVILKENYRGKYLTFIPLESGTFSFSLNDLQYSLDNGDTWQTLTAGQSTPVIPSYTKIMWKGENLTPTEANGIGTFSSTCNFKSIGNVMSLYFGDNFESQVDLTGKSFAFKGLFQNCNTIISAKNLVLPATTITESCYRTFFNRCENLEYGPEELPALTAATDCYRIMFQRCTSLKEAPILPATTLAERCYYYMFNSCESLKEAPILPATTLANECYQDMFRCAGLEEMPDLPATVIPYCAYSFMFCGSTITQCKELKMEVLGEDACYSMFRECNNLISGPTILPIKQMAFRSCGYMFQTCPNLTNLPQLPCTALTDNCYIGMFRNCPSVTTAPVLPAKTLTTKCYNELFNNCTSLNYVKCLATDISATGCLTSWLNNVSSTGTFVKDPNTTWPSGTAGIPAGWTVQDSAD